MENNQNIPQKMSLRQLKIRRNLDYDLESKKSIKRHQRNR